VALEVSIWCSVLVCQTQAWPNRKKKAAFEYKRFILSCDDSPVASIIDDYRHLNHETIQNNKMKLGFGAIAFSLAIALASTQSTTIEQLLSEIPACAVCFSFLFLC